MGWTAFCDIKTKASKRYRRRMGVAMVAYVVVLLAASWVVKHGHAHGWALYFWSVLPAVPIVGMLAEMGRYLQEEKDEYVRAVMVRSLLAATAALLGTLVANDFLRAFAAVGALPPFVCFVLFFMAFAVAQAVQSARNQVSGSD